MTPDEMRAEAARLTALAEENEKQLTGADVTRMYADRQYEQIEQARQSGRLDQLLNGA